MPVNGKIAKMVPLIISEYLPRAASEYLGYKKVLKNCQFYLVKRRLRGGQKSPILRPDSVADSDASAASNGGK